MILSRSWVRRRPFFLFFLALCSSFTVMATPGGQEPLQADRINLALRRTADGLLRHAGDSTSRIPAIEQTAPNIWRVRLEQSFSYEELPAILQASLDLHGIDQPYEVAVRRCKDTIIDLGYHQFDFLRDSVVPCGGREISQECHFIEVTFLHSVATPPSGPYRSWIWLLVLAEGVVIWFLFRRKASPATASTAKNELVFGQSRLHVDGQILTSGDVKQNLTFRETKLLRLFVEHADQLLEREVILQQVWEDEGILVGRSVDVFVSRLRKKLAVDPTVVIATVHGVGYRLETGKSAESPLLP